MIKFFDLSRLALFYFVFNFTCLVVAETPPSSDEGGIRWSVDRLFFALSHSGELCSTICYDAKSGKIQWTIPKFFSDCYLSEGGEYLVGISQGGNLIDLDDSDEKIIVSFWKKESRIAAYTVRDLKGMGLRMERTQSHWAWANDYGVIGSGFYIIDPLGGVFIFLPHTGELYMQGKLDRLDISELRKAKK